MYVEGDLCSDLPLAINALWCRDGEQWEAWERPHHPASLHETTAMVLRYLAGDMAEIPTFQGGGMEGQPSIAVGGAGRLSLAVVGMGSLSPAARGTGSNTSPTVQGCLPRNAQGCHARSAQGYHVWIAWGCLLLRIALGATSYKEIWEWLMYVEGDLCSDLPLAINALWCRDGEQWEAWERPHHPASLHETTAMVLRYLAGDMAEIPTFQGGGMEGQPSIAVGGAGRLSLAVVGMGSLSPAARGTGSNTSPTVQGCLPRNAQGCHARSAQGYHVWIAWGCLLLRIALGATSYKVRGRSGAPAAAFMARCTPPDFASQGSAAAVTS
ncbi:UNVERIFIED_CONTAM: hypothetical protein FKN15_027605 [Acipenser sinensis]